MARFHALIPPGAPRRAIWIATALLLLAGGWAVLVQPLTTLRGVDYRVTAYRIPAYVKAIDFLHRHYQYRLLAQRICEGKASDAECVMAIFDWTHENIPPTPPEWPVVDDHPLHIVIRGHGGDDQITDVFVILTGYAGVPSYFKWLDNRVDRLVLGLSRLEGKWVVFDVRRHLVFRDRNGRLADVEGLIADPGLVDLQAAGAVFRYGSRYSSFFSRAILDPLAPPTVTRAEMQQPWPRLQYELRRAVGWAP